MSQLEYNAQKAMIALRMKYRRGNITWSEYKWLMSGLKI